MSEKMDRHKSLTPLQQADLERLFRMTYKGLVASGEAIPFAAMMAARAELIELNRLIPPG